MRFADERLIPIWEKVQHQQRLTRDDGLLLFDTGDVLGLGRMADHVKSGREGDRVYFRNPNGGQPASNVPGARVENPATGLESMSLEDFRKRCDSFSAPISS